MYFYIFNLLVVLLLSVCSLEAKPCRNWCRKPMSFDFYCCDSITATKDPRVLSVTSTVSSSVKTETPPTTTKKFLFDGTCRYYCVYNGEVYCCDEGHGPMPADHDIHEGRCPLKKEQLCKIDGVFIRAHSVKVFTKDGSRMLSPFGRGAVAPTCASDGYCAEHEKCCQTICAKKHTCLSSVYDYGGGAKDKKKILKKDKKKEKKQL